MRYYLFGLCLFLAVSSCVETGYKTNVNLPQLRDEWAREYEAWKTLDIPNYQFTYQLPDNYGWGWALRITVKNKSFHNAFNIRKEEDVSEWWHFTIDDVFTSIAHDFDRDEDKSEIHDHLIGTTFRISYDQEYHFPALYSVVYNYNVPVGGNGSKTIIKDFTIINE